MDIKKKMWGNQVIVSLKTPLNLKTIRSAPIGHSQLAGAK